MNKSTMITRRFILLGLLALAGCAVNPPATVDYAALVADADREVADREADPRRAQPQLIAISRATMSELPPAAKPLTSLIGRIG